MVRPWIQSKFRNIVVRNDDLAYDTNLSVMYPKSAAKAMYTVIRQSRR